MNEATKQQKDKRIASFSEDMIIKYEANYQNLLTKGRKENKKKQRIDMQRKKNKLY